jgi:hypothetical protein
MNLLSHRIHSSIVVPVAIHYELRPATLLPIVRSTDRVLNHTANFHYSPFPMFLLPGGTCD